MESERRSEYAMVYRFAYPTALLPDFIEHATSGKHDQISYVRTAWLD